MGTPSMTVYLDYKGTPHTFVKVDDGAGNVKYFGFAPKVPGSPIGAGNVGVGITTHAIGDPDNSKAGYIDDVAFGKTITLTAEGYTAVIQTVENWQVNTPNYNVVGTNCTAFVKALLQAGNALYPGIGSGPNPFNLIPVSEQGLLFTPTSDGASVFSDAIRDPLNTPGTPAYQHKQDHPELYNGAVAPKSDVLGYSLDQNPDGTWTETVVRESETGLRSVDATVLYDTGALQSEVLTTFVTGNVTEVQTDTNADGTLDTRALTTATGTNPLTTLQDIQSAEHVLTDLNAQGQLDTGYYHDFTQWSSDVLVFGGNTLWTLGPDFNLSLDPIGAFYESRTPATDTAPGIADKTPVLLNAANVGLTAAALVSLDTNTDGKLSGNELAPLTLWSDLNQNGLLDAGELKTPTQAGLGEITAADYAFYTAGNSQFAESADTTPDSHYRTLRDTDNIYNYQTPAGIHGSFIWTTSQIKINAGQPTYLIGTDGNDGFDAASFEQAYTNAGLYGAFNAALLTNFLGGDGNDTVGGSVRNDQIWGGTGDDVLLGYAGNDHIHGENGGDILVGQEGQDILNGGAGNDIMVGGLSNDSLWGGEGADEINGGEGEDRLYGEAGDDGLFGQVGDDILYGGDGNDLLVGFTGTNEIKQTLDPGETDNDHLYGGAGSDTLLGGLGNDYLDGGAGADIMEGGAGDDSYIVNSVNDIILEQPGAGHDTVTSSVNYLLNAHIEDLRLLDGLDINGSGNALDNRIVGNSRDNILDGITGADTLTGGAGNDTYYVDNSGDQTIEQANEGTDTVQRRGFLKSRRWRNGERGTVEAAQNDAVFEIRRIG